jgi:hypothetical protein
MSTPELTNHAGVILLSVVTAWFVGRQLTPAGTIVSPTTLIGLAAWSGAAFLFFSVIRGVN